MAFAVPIQAKQTTSGNQFNASRIIEEAGQTFYAGTPVMLNGTDGGLQAWDGTSLTNAIAGISYEGASNLGTTGSGAPGFDTGVTGKGATLTSGSVPNQPAASDIPHGAPLNDGRCGLYTATGDTIFSGALGNSGTASTPAATNVGNAYGLTKDSNGYWYVDVSKTGASAAVRVVALDGQTPAAAGSSVLFVFLPAVVNITGV